MSNSSCPDPVAEWPVGNWPAANQIIGLDLFVVTSVVYVASVVYMFAMRNQYPYNTRNVPLVAISGLGLVVFSFALSFREYVGRELYGCDTHMWLSFLAVTLWLAPMSVQLFQLKNRLALQNQIQIMSIHDADEEALTLAKSTKFKSSNLRASGVMLFYLLITGLTVIILAVMLPFNFHECTGCDLSFFEFSVQSVLMLYLMALVLYGVRIYPSPEEGQPAHPMTGQIKKLIKFFLPVYELFVLLILIDPNQLHATGVFSWYHIPTALFATVILYTTMVPGLWAEKPTQNKQIQLASVLRNEDLKSIFENFLKSEFKIQILRFFMEASELNKAALDKEVSSITWCQHARDICSMFVAPSGLATVNELGSQTRQQLCEQVGTEGDNLEPGNMFETAVKEVEVLLQGELFDRFVALNKERLISGDKSV